MKETLDRALEGGALKLAAGTGVAASANSAFDFLNNNASGIGVLIALFSMLIGWYYSYKRHNNENLKDENEKLKDELSKLSSRKRDKK